MSAEPSKFFKSIRLSKKSSLNVSFITVGQKKYTGEKVADGLYDSISSLKKENKASLYSSPKYTCWSQEYSFIKQLCKDKKDIPKLSIKYSTAILKRMKPNVRDFWSITPLHYLKAGQEGLLHFNFLMNVIINNINSSTIKELNTVFALLLHKGHGKSRTSDRSYRTISTCPVISKALDMYIHDLHIAKWNEEQAETQYQGEGSNHDLAALLITEAIQHSLLYSKESIYLLFLDARSAFDTVVPKFLIRNLYFAGLSGDSLLYIDNRLNSRLTYCNWDEELMGPIKDEHGLEQGGCNSSDNYKSYNNDLLKWVQNSKQGVDLGNNLVVSGVGQADDVVLLSNNIYSLFNILHIALKYCKEYHVDLCADKTKLIMMTPRSNPTLVHNNPIKINEEVIEFSKEAEHVGVIRSINGNTSHILNRIVSHKKALGAILHSGAALNHRGNIAGVIKIEKLYALPVLLSGSASLVLNKAEENILDHHYTGTLRKLLKACPNTPRSFVHFMCGSLPASAFLHLRQLGLFCMITRLPDDPLNLQARHVLTTHPPTSKSWFMKVRSLCLQYDMPHPLQLLNNPLSKDAFKKLSKSKVINHWEIFLRSEAAILPSLIHPKLDFYSLTQTHPILSMPGSNPHEVSKAVIQTKMLSGRYQTALLTRHWSPSRSEWCPAITCSKVPESLEHILLYCPYYASIREQLILQWARVMNRSAHLLLFQMLSGPASSLLSFILDPSTHPTVIKLVQELGLDMLKIFMSLTRNWCWAVHKGRASLLVHLKFK